MSKELVVHRTNAVTVRDITIPILEYKGQRVITLGLMDKLHNRAEGTARRNFNENKEKLEDGRHYFHATYQELTQMNEIRTSGITPNPNGLIFITERGYLLLVKSFTDDFAWEVQEQLVDNYFDRNKPMTTAEFLVQQAQLILEHEQKLKRNEQQIKKLEERQDSSDKSLEVTRLELEATSKKAEEALAAALQHKFGEPSHYSILGFCNKHGIKISTEEAKAKGVKASTLSRQKGIEKQKIPDGRFGQVGSYHVTILEEIFSDKLIK
jgi:ORF6N domain